MKTSLMEVVLGLALLSTPPVFGQQQIAYKANYLPLEKTIAISEKAPVLSFIENKGQWGHGIRYQASIPGGVMFLTGNGFVYNFISETDEKTFNEQLEAGRVKLKKFHFHAYKVNFEGANPLSEITNEGFEKRSNYNNYFIGNNPSKWASHVGLFGKVKLGNIYNGVDVYVYNNGEKASDALEYDFIVAKGANPGQIRLSFDGVKPAISPEGSLVIQTTVNTIEEHAPYCYQEIDGKKVAVNSKYVLKNGILSFAFPNGYNQNYPLVIDPLLIFATYSGGSSSNFYAHSTTYDSLGDVYASGLAAGYGWPTTAGAYQTSFPGGIGTACINKYDAAGSSLLFSTYFGGTNGCTEPNTLRVDNNNDLVMGGCTTTTTLPTTTGAYQTSSGGSQDIYISKFSSDGTTLLASTYMGGSDNEASTIGDYDYEQITVAYGLGLSQNPRNPVEVTFDKNDNIWVTSNTASSNFPTTANAEQSSLGGDKDAVVFELDSNCDNLLYSSYLGGSGWDGGIGIEFDPDSNLVVVGMTNSSDFPTTDSALHTTNQGGDDGFVTRINPSTGAIINSTYLGTSGTDDAERVAFDNDGNVYVAGRSLSGTYPVSTGAWSCSNGNIYVQKLSPDLSTSIKSTTVGAGNLPYIVATGFMVDECGDIVLGTFGDGTFGGTQSNLNVTSNAIQTTASPFYMVIISKDFNTQLFGSYFGVSTDHFHPGVSRLDKKGIYYQSVCNNATFPTTIGSYAATQLNSPNQDVVTFKLQFPPTNVHAGITLPTGWKDTGCAPYTLHLGNNSTSPYGMTFTWNPGDGSPLTTGVNFTHTYDSAGTYYITLHAHSDSACIQDNETTFKLTVVQVFPPNIVTSPDTLVCNTSNSIKLWVHINNPDTNQTIKWTPTGGILSPDNQDTATVNPAINTYYVTVIDSVKNFCGFTTRDTIHINNYPRSLKILTSDTTVCKGSQVQVLAESAAGYTFLWSPNTGVNDSTVLSPVITANQTQTYTLTAKHPGCLDTAQTLTINVEEYPQVNLGNAINVCQWQQASLSSSVTPYRNDYIYQWTPAAYLSTSTGPNATLNTADTAASGWYFLHVKTPIGCSGMDSVHVTIFPGNFGVFSPDTAFCLPGQAKLWAAGGVKYTWVPSDGLNHDDIADPVASPVSTTEYTVYVQDVHGCLDTGEVVVSIFPGAVLNMPDSVTLYSGESYHLEPGTNCTYFSWFPTNGVNATNVSDPVFDPAVRTRYFVTARTENGCEIKDSIDVLREGTVINVPNAFEPGNGDDGTFKIDKRGIAYLKDFSVYNRWGNKVFSTENINQGWDGTYNGKPQPLGVYVYTIEAVTNSGEVITKRGDVTLIR